MVSPAYPVYTNAEREALRYKKVGGKLYRTANISVPGIPDPAFPDIDFSNKPSTLQELRDLLDIVENTMIDVQFDVGYEHYGGYSEYDSCEVTTQLCFHGKIEFEADGELLTNYNSAKAKEKQYNADLRTYNAEVKARNEEKKRERDRKQYERLKKKFEDE